VNNRTPGPAHDHPKVGVPGLVLIVIGVIAFVICVVSFSLAWVGVGTWSGIVALLSSAAGLAWLTDEGRRQRGNRPLIPLTSRTAGID